MLYQLSLVYSLFYLCDTVQISYKDICGSKLLETCPNTVNTKIVGGDSSCAEKVPWNVLVENTRDRGGFKNGKKGTEVSGLFA